MSQEKERTISVKTTQLLISILNKRLKSNSAISSKILNRLDYLSQLEFSNSSLEDFRFHNSIKSILGTLYTNLNNSYKDTPFSLQFIGELDSLPQSLIEFSILIILELVENALQHAFSLSEGEIHLLLEQSRGILKISVADTGIGYEYNEKWLENNGFFIIRCLAEHYGGILKRGVTERSSGTGTTIVVEIPHKMEE